MNKDTKKDEQRNYTIVHNFNKKGLTKNAEEAIRPPSTEEVNVIGTRTIAGTTTLESGTTMSAMIGLKKIL